MISIYVLATTMVTVGISTAVIRIITESLAQNQSKALIGQIMKKVYCIAIVFSAIITFVFFHLAPYLSRVWLKDERCIAPIQTLVLILPIISISSCLKGYFLAKRKVIINATSQLVEQMVRMSLIWICLERLPIHSFEKMCQIIVVSDMISEVASCVFLWGKYRKEKTKQCIEKEKAFSLSYFFQIAFPVTLNKCLSSFLRTVENVLIPNQLALFCASRELALADFGTLKGMALPLIFFPASFLTAFSTLMVPEVAEEKQLKNQSRLSRLTQKTFEMTLASGIIIAAIFYEYHEPIASLFYPQSHVAFFLKNLSLLIPFMYLESAVTGIMQGLNQQRKVLYYNILDSCIRISLIYLVVPHYGMKGFIIIMYLSNILTSSLNAYRVLKVSTAKFSWSNWVIKPLLSAMAAIVMGRLVFARLMLKSSWITLGVKVLVVCMSYLFLITLYGLCDIKVWLTHTKKLFH